MYFSSNFLEEIYHNFPTHQHQYKPHLLATYFTQRVSMQLWRKIQNVIRASKRFISTVLLLSPRQLFQYLYIYIIELFMSKIKLTGTSVLTHSSSGTLDTDEPDIS
jgi:hypothetical protein